MPAPGASQTQIKKVAAELDAANPGHQLGARFIAFANAHPGWTLSQLESGFAAQVGLGGVGQGVTQGIGAGAQALGQAETQASAAAGKATIIPNPLSSLSWLGGISHWLGVAVTDLTDVHMWISFGWVILGLWLMWMGLLLWLRVPQRLASAGMNIGGAAAKAAI